MGTMTIAKTSTIKSPKTNYYDKSLEILSKLGSLKKKPTLLLHACCGPCSCFPLTFLCPHFDVTIYYNNSNIYPASEFDKRLETLQELLEDLKRDYGFEVKLITPPYDNLSYNKELEAYKTSKEGGARCLFCYEKRMREAYDYADKNGFDFFCTVMTISRQKNSQILNEIGKKLEKEHPNCPYFYSDFKKKDGALKGREIRLRYNLYNQNYCGCIYSYREMLERTSKEGQKESKKQDGKD